MSTYEQLKGLKVKYLSADTSGDRLQEGELFYNSSDFGLKSHIAVGAWSAGANLLVAKIANGNVGLQTAALSCGGFINASDGNPDRKTDSEEYDGTGWTTGGTMNTAKSSGVTYGTQTAALAAQGESVNSEEYNGTAWTEGNNMGTARGENGIQFGIQTAAVAAGGSPNKALVEEYDGTSWSEVNNLPAANFAGHGAGTLTAGLGFGGYTTATAAETLAYDGTNWTDVGNMNLARRNGTANFGTASLAYVAGGITPTGNRQTTGAIYDGTSWAALSASLGTGRQHNGGMGAGGSSTTSGLACGGNIAPNNSTGATEEFNISTSTVTGAAWASGGNLNTKRKEIGGLGTQTAALAYGGRQGSDGERTESEEYNGSTWAEGNNLATGRRIGVGAGTQTAGLAAGGYSTGYVNLSEEYNGTSWSEGNNLNTARGSGTVGFGLQTAAAAVGGYTGTAHSGLTEHYDGTSWTNSNALNKGRSSGTSAGTQTAGLYATGSDGASPLADPEVEEYNGTSWSEVNNVNQSAKFGAGFGLQTSAITCAGRHDLETSVDRVTSEIYDGTSWVTSASLANARGSGVGDAGTTSAGLVFGGDKPDGDESVATEEFTPETTALNIKTLTDS